MKRFIWIFIIVAATSLSVQAQFLKFGIRGGVSSSSIKPDDVLKINNVDSFKIVGNNATVGFHIGVFARMSISKLFIEPELLFSNSGGEVQVKEVISGNTSWKSQKFNKIDIPVLVGWKFGPARIEAGPVASFMLSSKSNLFDAAAYEADFKKATIGYQAGVGIDLFKTLAIDLKYEGNLSKLGDGVTIGGQNYPYDTRASQIILSLGLFF